MKNDFKGNKQSLPSKLCAVCGRTMTWRKAWAKNWESVLYCSNACRTNKKEKHKNDRVQNPQPGHCAGRSAR
jgi:hypothetical protein